MSSGAHTPLSAAAASNPAAVCALLDDSACGRARLYTAFVRAHTCTDPAQLAACWDAVVADQRRGLHAVLLADYEWGVALAGLAPHAPGCLQVLMFAELAHLHGSEVQAWLAAQEGRAQPGAAGPLDLRASVDEAAFTAAIDAIHEAIRAGETYQVNYTWRLHGGMHGHPVALYRRLRARQPVAYGAYIVRPGGAGQVLSFSPELFLRHEGGVLTARPMKGTAARAELHGDDHAAAAALQADEKNRSENLMIVDLLRNDLGRVARTGGVRVSELFAVQTLPTLHQMTSTIQADLRADADFPALLRALFPCGSITGAPKHQTMRHIARLETTPRGMYCGAIGWVDAPPEGGRQPAIGDFCLSVAIRTAVLAAPDATGARPLTLGVGAGITLASDAAAEYAECLLKARFLTAMDPGLELIETLRVERGAAPLRARHRARMAASARALGLPFDGAEFDALLDAQLRSLAPEAHRLRLLLDARGLRLGSMAALEPQDSAPVALVWAAEPLAPTPLSAHKTSARGHYDRALAQASARGAFDAVFVDAQGALVEGARSNVLVQVDGQWLTPRLQDGALPGVMRAHLLAHGLPDGSALAEAHLPPVLWQRATAWAVCNAVRGLLPALAPQ